MAGLLDFLPEMDKSTAIGLLAAGSQMMNTPRQQGGMGTIGNGLLGFAQGLLAQKQQEKEDARQAQQDARQSRLDDASIAKDNAMIQHYQAQPSGGDPYWTTISTPQGLQKFNARTGEMIQITDPQGNPIMKASDSPDLQGAIAGNKSRNAEAWKPDTIKNTNGSETRGLGKDLYNGLNSGLPRKVLQDGQYHDLADYIPIAQQFVPNIMSVESGGNPNAVSETGAQGLMQVIPSTGRDPGYNVIPLRNKSSDENVRFGTDYFAAMLKKNGGDVQAALRDYNGNSDPRYVEKVMNASPTDKIIAASQPLTQNAQTGIEIAVQNGANPKQATENVVKSLNQTVDNLKRNNVYTGQSTYEKEAAQQQAKLDYAEPTAKAEKVGAIQGEAQGKAAVELPQAQSDAAYSLDLLNQIKHHPGLEKGVGASSIFFDKVPGTEAYDFKVLNDQVKGRNFMQTFQSLKGGGQITEIEGEKATAAISRMSDRKQSKESYLKAVNELQSIIQQGVQRKAAAANGGQQAQPQIHVDDLVGKYLR